MNLRYGLKEVADVIFFDISTGKPAIFFDTLKVSTLENESESAEARGGQGNGRLMTWDYGRTASLTMQDALLSDISLAMLSGNQVKNTGINAHGRENLIVSGSSITIEHAPIDTVSVYKVEGGLLTDEVTVDAVTGQDVTLTGATDGDQVMAFYEYEAGEGSSQVTFSGNAFPSTYKVVGTTVVRGEDGNDRKMQFIIPKAKLQSSFSLTMDAENVSTFDFNLDVLVQKNAMGVPVLYDIIRLA